MSERISKKQAVERQLHAALDIYFSGGDLLVAWTLAAAAYNILRDLRRVHGGPPMMLKEQLPDLVPAEDKSNLVKGIQAVENFLKHADRDPHEWLEFAPSGQIELLLFDASVAFFHVFGEDSRLLQLMREWFLSHACVDHDGGAGVTAWLRKTRAHPSETPAEYRRRMMGDSAGW